MRKFWWKQRELNWLGCLAKKSLTDVLGDAGILMALAGDVWGFHLTTSGFAFQGLNWNKSVVGAFQKPSVTSSYLPWATKSDMNTNRGNANFILLRLWWVTHQSSQWVTHFNRRRRSHSWVAPTNTGRFCLHCFSSWISCLIPIGPPLRGLLVMYHHIKFCYFETKLRKSKCNPQRGMDAEERTCSLRGKQVGRRKLIW